MSVCSGNASEVHLCLDKYIEYSIKDSEREFRGSVQCQYIITGPEQTLRQSGKKLLNNKEFKNEISKFLLREWQKDHYYCLFSEKVLYASHGGECFKFVANNAQQSVTVTKPSFLQGHHEEADTMIVFHIAQTSHDVIVRASDTDVLIILIGYLGDQHQDDSSRNIFMDCGIGNHRRYIDVNSIVNGLENLQPGLSTVMPAYHAFTGCDFTSAFYR